MPKKAKTAIDNTLEETNTEAPPMAIPATSAMQPQVPIQKNQIFEKDGELVVDVYETETDFVVTSAIAGVQIKDLDISLEKDMIVIKGDRANPDETSNKKYFYQECHWGPFSRKVVLPENIDIDRADAQIDKGILTIKIPKNSSGNGKIGIKVA